MLMEVGCMLMEVGCMLIEVGCMLMGDVLHADGRWIAC